jgi:hypothetical protein
MSISRFVFAFVAAVGLCGCASTGPNLPAQRAAARQSPVRTVDFHQTPEMKELAQRARQLGKALYPKIVLLLAEDISKAPRQFDVVFKRNLRSGNTGTTKRTTIELNASCFATNMANPVHWFAKDPTNFDTVLVHEMAHVVQQYRGMAPIYWTKAPHHWEEGIADYVTYKLGYTNGAWCPQCSADYPHYTSGYRCTGAFLLFVDETCGSHVVRQLNAALCRGSYSDKFFATATGKSLDELWAEFQKTSAFTPLAAEINE